MIMYIWRHPKPIEAKGLCIGQTDIAVDVRKIKRLANKIERFVRLHQLPKVILVSPLRRSLAVGQILEERGFQYYIVPELAEIDFGIWEGRSWEQIAKQDIDDWCNDFAHFAPTDGESLYQLFIRIERWLNTMAIERGINDASVPILAVGHAGWINAAKMIAEGKSVPTTADKWPCPVDYLERSQLDF